MGVETATFISQLSATNPLGTDPISEGDNQIRLVKDVLQNQFTTLGAAAVTTTAGELNILDGVTATYTELNYLDITTLGTSADSKALTQSAGGVVTVGATSGDQVLNIASHDLVDGGLKLAGTLVTASATELNLLDGKSVVGDAVLATDQSWTGSQRGTPQTITQGTLIDLDTGNNFLYTPAAADELSFANETTGQSGFIKLINPSGYTISLGSEVKAVSTFASDVTVAGTYLITYFSDGTNVYVSASAVLV
tara:strand:+ start:36 stop:791 length:756 start_codon:yes stop_codon:yes gene_type:complete